MDTIKNALQKELITYEDHRKQVLIGDKLFGRLLEKKRRRELRIRLCLQACVLLLMLAFLCFIFLFPDMPVLPAPQISTRILLLLAFLVFMDTCQRILACITWRKH
jgi:hypothetical protein